MTSRTQTQTPVKPRKPRPRPERHARISPAVNGCHALLLEVGKEQFGYYLEPCPASEGQGFLLTKFEHCQEEGEPTSYHVLVNGMLSSCECRGFLRWGMGKDGTGCKHIASLARLIAEGKLAVTSKAQPSKASPAADSIDIDSF